jgi:regulator of cell morphogenesis and NO signaling
METTQTSTLTLGEFVHRNYRTASVFEKYSLDFCCRGGRTVEEACAEKGVDANVVKAELSVLEAEVRDPQQDNVPRQMDLLVDHIVTTHHAYVRDMIPVIQRHAEKVASVHGTNHPEMIRVAAIFLQVSAELSQHMLKEEKILFPIIAALAAAGRNGRDAHTPPFRSVAAPIRMMEEEHRAAGDALYEIRSLTKEYSPPEDACTTFRVLLKELADFEFDLHRHVHLENGILFPESIALENRLYGAAGRGEMQ